MLQSANIFKPQNNEPVYPSPAGGNTWSAAAFSPLTQDFYVPGANMAWSYYQDKDAKPYTPGTPVAGQFIGGRMHIISGVDKNIDTYSGQRDLLGLSMSIPERSPGSTSHSIR